jgi:hypothetical protein
LFKDLIKKVIADLKSDKDGFCRITHKEGWFGFLADGDLVFNPGELHQKLRQIIDTANMRPRGDKLLFLRTRNNFTVMLNKTPYRTEEALERFITTSNSKYFFNQIPIGGGKESIDIGIEENDARFVFVELKPWSNSNSPLYALVESLKNLIEYRIIKERNLKYDRNFKDYREVNLIVLAPYSYYRTYGLIDSSEAKIGVVKKALNDLSAEFDTNISLMELSIKEEDFDDRCKKICEEQNIEEWQSIFISKMDAMPELARDQWKLLVASDRISTRS